MVLINKQVYHLSSRKIELDVNTYLTIDPKARPCHDSAVSQSGWSQVQSEDGWRCAEAVPCTTTHCAPAVNGNTRCAVVDAMQSGKIVRHQDRWNNSRFAVPGLLKKPTGLFTSGLLKAFGWGRHIDEAAPAK